MLSDEEAEEVRKKLLEQLENLPEEQQEQVELLRKQIKAASKEQLDNFIKAQVSRGRGGQGECIFCQIIEGKLETIRIYEDKEIIVILDLYPASLGHMLVMPREHYETLQEMPDALLSKIFLFVKAIIPSFLKVTQAKGFNIFVAQGEQAGQRVKHFCIHLIPRYGKDKVNFDWERLQVNKEELERLGGALRKEASKEITKKLEAEREKAEKKKREEEKSETEKIMRHIKRRLP